MRLPFTLAGRFIQCIIQAKTPEEKCENIFKIFPRHIFFPQQNAMSHHAEINLPITCLLCEFITQ